MSRCRHCDYGDRLVNGEHWVVQSLSPPTVKIVPCKAHPRLDGCKACGNGPCKYGVTPEECSVEKAA